MNYDRFLTRIFDRELKKMIFPGDPIGDGGDIFLGIKDDYMLISYPYLTHEKSACLYTIGQWKFGDRFIPMLCTGRKDKKGSLIYCSDIVMGWNSNHPDDLNTIHTNSVITYFDDSYDFSICPNRTDYGCELHEGRNLEIIGNRWENPELLPQSTL